MAETFLLDIAQRVVEKIAHLSMEEVALAFNVERTMSSIKAVLLDAERQQHQNKKLRLCMWKLRDIFYDAEDVDDFKCEALRKQVRFLASCSLPLFFSFKMGHKIKSINQRLNELATVNNFNLGLGTDNRYVFHRETHSCVNYSDFIGRDVDKENIIDLLMKPSEDPNIPVIPIVGIGGLGKTTLTQLIWICVSDEFDLSRLLKLIIHSINKGQKCDNLTVEALQICLRSLLNDKKFLLVLDDETVDILGSMDYLCGSKIIVTTRSLKVAFIMSSIHPYELKQFNNKDEKQYPNLMKIRKEIVQNENDILPVLKLSYNHLPSHLQQCLAFLSLYKKDEIYYSDQVHPKQKQDWEDVGDQYLNELISRCLTQMNQDYGDVFTFKMHDLIHDLALEVSQKECKIVNCQTKTIDENVRHLSFCDDKQINVAQVFTKLKNVRTVMVQEVSKESKAIHESLVSLCVSNFKYIRALCLQDSPLATLPNSIGALKHLRELDLTNCCNIKKLPSSFYKLRRLQSLRMRGAPLMQLPVSMESLIELRYLEITIKDKKLKGSRLRNWTSLQCLVLVDCDNLECLSKKMKCLTGLSHLILYGCTELSNRYYINGRLDWQEWLKNDCLRD
ncbi:hypothetical protein GOBAR_AA34730 [Gossypium barbadense]|uniref:NB-ARC domain-containing protein n=1 Tax=Gossypium barbadense TaxID=3634 RepID=A0A2P5W4F6_GOSBA|nr:hypothetical protein GOBAR_AA34730 [Gossypium barbadense]